jgi:hypothetical protein
MDHPDLPPRPARLISELAAPPAREPAMTPPRPDPGRPAAHSQHDLGTSGPHWEVRVGPAGLTAVLTGMDPPITVTAPDLDTLRKNIKTVIFRALL